MQWRFFLIIPPESFLMERQTLYWTDSGFWWKEVLQWTCSTIFWKSFHECYGSPLLFILAIPEVLYKKAAVKNFAILANTIAGKNICWSLALIKFQPWMSAILLKRDSNASFFLWILQNVENYLRTAPSGIHHITCVNAWILGLFCLIPFANFFQILMNNLE